MPFALMPFLLLAAAVATATDAVERWAMYEVELAGPSGGNPYMDVELVGRFEKDGRVFEPHGFYDGDGVYRIRFMPDETGAWTYTTRSNAPELDGASGSFTCVEPSAGNHGPVKVVRSFHFAYADGTPHHSIGTTCYAWTHQGDAMEEQTLATLSGSPFNKIRMCVFPKSYTYNQNEPGRYPFEGTPLRDWDTTRFNPDHFQHFEKRVGQLLALGIEADIILFHPYDRWGFKEMDSDADDRYLRYVVARLAAYRNVWWSMANEFDFFEGGPEKSETKGYNDWDRFFQIVRDNDPYDRLRSIHNGSIWYDHNKPWVDHASIQTSNFDNTAELREKYGKPLVYDECRYEGNIPLGWGNISGEQMTQHFWLGTTTGSYVGHGETYKHPEDLLWWSKGGTLTGESPARIAFLRDILEDAPTFADMDPSHPTPSSNLLSKPGEYYLLYASDTNSGIVSLTGDRAYKVDFIDTWEMTVTPVGSAKPGEYAFTPPKPASALRFTPYADGEARRPTARAEADVTEGVAPVTVSFSSDGDGSTRVVGWDFGDGSSSDDAAPAHTYADPGIYIAAMTVSNASGARSTAFVRIAVDRHAGDPIARIAFPSGSTPELTLHGQVETSVDGALYFSPGKPWGRAVVGDAPLADLVGLSSFTVLGWARPEELDIGSGGNRIVFSLNGSQNGIDLVHLADGRMRLSVNEWPDGVKDDSSPGRLRIGEWTFFAVTYDSTVSKGNVRWYFGDESTPADADTIVTYNRGATASDGGPLAIGNFNRTMQGHGYDRQFRGHLRGLEIYGSRIGPRGALSLEDIQDRQHAQ
jgi:PKD repeat protein